MPTEARTHHHLAIALGRAGRGAAALPHYAEAERLKPTDPPFAYNHGVALVRLGRGDEAIARAEATLRLRPDYADAHFNRAAARRARPADSEFRTAMPGARIAVANAEDAIAHYRTVLAAEPANAAAHFGHGNALTPTRRRTETVAADGGALRLAPDDANTHDKLG